jgi:hypothetical protein
MYEGPARREASGPAKDMMAQTRRDYQLHKMLADTKRTPKSSA